MLSPNGNPFIICTDAPYSLNYLIYTWKLIDVANFKTVWLELWNDWVRRLADGRMDHGGILDSFRQLFHHAPDGDAIHIASVNAFRTWWGSHTGQAAVEHSFTNDKLRIIDDQLSGKIAADHVLKIRLIYEPIPASGLIVLPWQAVVPIQYILDPAKLDELLLLLLNCCKDE
ncbi:hypothetical protein AB4Z21_12730 [Paenibacillus sp. MCAF20]